MIIFAVRVIQYVGEIRKNSTSQLIDGEGRFQRVSSQRHRYSYDDIFVALFGTFEESTDIVDRIQTVRVVR